MVSPVEDEWFVTAIGDDEITEPPGRRRPSIEFTDEGRIAGTGGVNRITGSYTLTDDTLSIGPVASTMMAGPPEAMELERRVLLALGRGGKVSIDGDVLTIEPADPEGRERREEREEREERPTVAGSGGGDLGVGRGPGDAGDAGDLVRVDGALVLRRAGRVTGTVWYRERIAMPEGAVVKVKLADVSRADAPADILAERRIVDPGNVPVAFSLGFDPTAIVDTHSYTVSATIEAEGQVMWRSTSHNAVLTRGASDSVDVMLTRG